MAPPSFEDLSYLPLLKERSKKRSYTCPSTSRRQTFVAHNTSYIYIRRQNLKSVVVSRVASPLATIQKGNRCDIC